MLSYLVIRGLREAAWRDILALCEGGRIDFYRLTDEKARMVEKDILIVAQSAGIPLAGCREDNHAT